MPTGDTKMNYTKLSLTAHQIEQMVGIIMNDAAQVSSPLTAEDIDYAIAELRRAFPITDDRDFTDATMNLRAVHKALLLAEFNKSAKEEDRLLVERDHGKNVNAELNAVMLRTNWLQNAYEAF